jgi:uncharacterized protein
MHPITYLSPYDRSQCDMPACFNAATVHFTRVDHRIPTEKIRVCGPHAKTVLERYWSDSVVGSGTPRVLPCGVEFDLSFMFLDEDTEYGKLPYFICLKEVGGFRRFGYKTGFYECWALESALQPSSSPYPSTHESLLQIVQSLHGQVDSILIDDFIATEQRFFSKVQIHLGEELILVNIRPSDAIIFAVVCDVPVFVAPAVVANFDNAVTLS